MQRKITKRKDGRYVAYMELQKQANGKRNRVPIYGKTPAEVEEKLIEAEYEKQNSVFVRGGKTFFENYMNEWVNVYTDDGKAETTAELYKMYVKKHINPEIGKLVLEKIIPMDIKKFCNLKRKTLSANTVSKLYVLLNRAFKDAVNDRLIKYNPCDGVDKPKKEKYTPAIYSEDQIIKLLEIVSGSVDEVLIILAGFVGLRRGEVFGLRWRDVNFDNHTISIKVTKVRFNKNIEKEPKTKSSCRTIKVPEFVITLLQEYQKKLKVVGVYVCDKFKPQSYSEHFRNLLIKHNLPPIRFHDLRHFNGTIMMKYGIADKVASKRLGHAQVSTTREIYQHVLEEIDTSAAKIIDDVYKSIKK